MQTLLLWIFALYGLTSLWIQIRKWLHHSRKKLGIHYYLYTHHSQGKIEWMIRYLSQLALLEGRSFHFSVYDFGSEDDTLAIIERLRKDGLYIELMPEIPELEAKDILLKGKEKPFGRFSEVKIVVDLRESLQDVPSCS